MEPRRLSTVPVLLLVALFLLQNANTFSNGAVVKPMSLVKRSDDAGSDVQALQTIVQQQAALISSLQASLTAVQTKLNDVESDVTGLRNAVQTPVAFSASFSADEALNGISLSHGVTLQFDHVINNVGNGYNPTSGVFTAPITGVYVFSLHMMEPKHVNGVMLDIVKQGTVLGKTWALSTTNDDDDQGATVVSTTLTQGQQVWVRVETGQAVRGSYWTVFTGYLLH